MLNEKRTVAALKDAFKSGGYKVLFFGGLVSVRAGYWAFEIGEELLPREVLGKIVEHIGMIPGNGEAYFCHTEGSITSIRRSEWQMKRKHGKPMEQYR